MKRAVLMAAALGLMSGCATYCIRFTDDVKNAKRIYPATCLDCSEFHEIADYGWWYIGIPMLLDVPFSVVSDTVCLPYDALK